ncbi:MAG: hypothetical protein Q8M16_16285 [Pirellulaceae bacterium]|nr:hypothetical protein [Pirellulaceae bacterium]
MMKKLVGFFLAAFAVAVIGCGGPAKPVVPTEGPKMTTDPTKMDEKGNSEKVMAPEE